MPRRARPTKLKQTPTTTVAFLRRDDPTIPQHRREPSVLACVCHYCHFTEHIGTFSGRASSQIQPLLRDASRTLQTISLSAVVWAKDLGTSVKTSSIWHMPNEHQPEISVPQFGQRRNDISSQRRVACSFTSANPAARCCTVLHICSFFLLTSVCFHQASVCTSVLSSILNWEFLLDHFSLDWTTLG